MRLVAFIFETPTKCPWYMQTDGDQDTDFCVPAGRQADPLSSTPRVAGSRLLV